MIDYCVEYMSLKMHEDTKKGDLFYVADLQPDGKLITHVVQVNGFRHEYNPFYMHGKGPKYRSAEYLVNFVFYKYKSFVHKLLSRKSMFLKEEFWVDNVFFRKNELEAKAALLSYISKEKVALATSFFELEYPGYLEKFQSLEGGKTIYNRHSILDFFSYQRNEVENNLSKDNILDKIPFCA